MQQLQSAAQTTMLPPSGGWGGGAGGTVLMSDSSAKSPRVEFYSWFYTLAPIRSDLEPILWPKLTCVCTNRWGQAAPPAGRPRKRSGAVANKVFLNSFLFRLPTVESR